MRRSMMGVVALLGLVMAASGLRGDEEAKVSGDLKKMQGTWTMMLGDGGEGQWVFKGDTVKVTLPNRKYTSTVTVNDAVKPFGTIDFKVTEGPEEAKDHMVKGIYKLDGNSLAVCVAGPDKDRPTELKAVEDETFLFELKKK